MLAPLVLDVGIGTFRPMTGARIDEHVMHAERYAIPAETARADRGRKARRRAGRRGGDDRDARAGRRRLAGGGSVRAGEGETRLFVTPGFRFGVVDALLTNFHLPRSTLLVLVAAFAGYGGRGAHTETAIAARYRFFSFGDAMFVETHTTRYGPEL